MVANASVDVNVAISDNELKFLVDELNEKIGIMPELKHDWPRPVLIKALKLVTKLLHEQDDIDKRALDTLVKLGADVPAGLLQKAELAEDTKDMEEEEMTDTQEAVAVEQEAEVEEVKEQVTEEVIEEDQSEGEEVEVEKEVETESAVEVVVVDSEEKTVEEEKEKASDSEEVEKEEKEKKEKSKVEKKTKTKTTKKQTRKTSTAKKGKTQKGKLALSKERLAYIKQLVEEEKYTRKELIAKVLEKYPGKASTVSTIISDCKSVKYTRFKNEGLLIEEGEDGILRFKKM